MKDIDYPFMKVDYKKFVDDSRLGPIKSAKSLGKKCAESLLKKLKTTSKVADKNWMRTPSDESFSVALRIYLPGEEYFSKLKRVDLPVIEKLKCGDE